jgi:hypothetical protein
MSMTKNERAALKADGFVNYYHAPANIRASREGLRGDIAGSDYFGDLAPTVVWVPDYLVVALGEPDAKKWDRMLRARIQLHKAFKLFAKTPPVGAEPAIIKVFFERYVSRFTENWNAMIEKIENGGVTMRSDELLKSLAITDEGRQS